MDYIIFSTTLTLTLLILFAIYYIGTAPEVKNFRDKIEVSELSIVTLQEKFLESSLGKLSRDLLYLKEYKLTQDYINASDLTRDNTKELLSDDLIHLMSYNPTYDQLRFISATGQELIRINNHPDGPVLVEDADLQNKAIRYYFTETMETTENSIYQSRLDLNIENGEIEIPIKPMIRFGVKLYDQNQNTFGILVINYNATELLSLFEEFSNKSEGETYLVDYEGHYLAGHETHNFSFMYDNASEGSYVSEYSEEWNAINQVVHNHDIVQFYDSHGLHTASEIAIDGSGTHQAHWYVISNVDKITTPYSSNESTLRVIFRGYLGGWIYIFPILLLSYTLTLVLRQRRLRLSEIQYMAQIDMMTKTYNREVGIRVINDQLEYARKNLMDYTVCFIDLNDLKLVNDTYGHESGDAYILKALEIIKLCFRESDELIRMGGDEFLIGMHASKSVVEKKWAKVIDMQETINQSGEIPYNISLSHGIASVHEDKLEDLNELIAFADRNMYDEKRRIKGK